MPRSPICLTGSSLKAFAPSGYPAHGGTARNQLRGHLPPFPLRFGLTLLRLHTKAAFSPARGLADSAGCPLPLAALVHSGTGKPKAFPRNPFRQGLIT